MNWLTVTYSLSHRSPHFSFLCHRRNLILLLIPDFKQGQYDECLQWIRNCRPFQSTWICPRFLVGLCCLLCLSTCLHMINSLWKTMFRSSLLHFVLFIYMSSHVPFVSTPHSFVLRDSCFIYIIYMYLRIQSNSQIS